MKTMWVVSDGEYSGYRVLCIASSKALARRIAAISTSSGYGSDKRIEELSYFEELPQWLEVLSIQQELWDDGTTNEPSEQIREEWEHDTIFPQYLRPVTWRWVRAPVHKNKGGRLEVAGLDHERVRKVFSEQRARIRAEDALRLQREIES